MAWDWILGRLIFILAKASAADDARNGGPVQSGRRKKSA
jgi:hypothetical protein